MSQALLTLHVNLLFIKICCENWWSLVWMQTIVLYSLVLINIVYPTVVMVTRDHHIPSTMPWWKWLKKCWELELYSYKTERGSTDIKQWLRNYDNINIQYKRLAPVVQKVDSAIRWINLYSVDNAIGFPNTYPLDRDLSGG